MDAVLLPDDFVIRAPRVVHREVLDRVTRRLVTERFLVEAHRDPVLRRTAFIVRMIDVSALILDNFGYNRLKTPIILTSHVNFSCF